MIRIILADDHPVMRRGLRLILEQQTDFVVLGEAADGREAISLVEALEPDVALLDIGMPNLNGVEAARQMTQKFPTVAVAILSMHADEGYVLRAVKAGVRAYLLKDGPEADLVQAIRSLAQGKAFFSPGVSRMLAQDYVRQLQHRNIEDSYELLTTREREILQLIAEGKSNKDVALSLGLSLYTVETHRSNILEKLDLHSVPELILYAVRKGVVS